MSNYDLSKLSALIADDLPPMRRIMRGILKEFGIRHVVEATDGARAMEILKESPVDLIVTDYQMQPLDGITLAKMIRQGVDGVDPFVPIILVTAYTEVKNILAARDAGVTEFLAKPISAKLVYYRIRAVVENPRPFVRANEYFGPDRRRRQREDFAGPDRRRKADAPDKAGGASKSKAAPGSKKR